MSNSMFLFNATSLDTVPLALQSVMRTTDKNAHLDGSPTEDSANLFIKRPRKKLPEKRFPYKSPTQEHQGRLAKLSEGPVAAP
jgi:hypothetical protein